MQNWLGPIWLIDASLQTSAPPSRRLSAVEALQVVLDDGGEQTRTALIGYFSQRLQVTSLRDTNEQTLDGTCIDYLRQTRTDIDYFNIIEDCALTTTGLALIHATSGADITNLGAELEQIANATNHIAANVIDTSMLEKMKMIATGLDVTKGDTDSTKLRKNLRVFLQKSSRMLFKDQGASHPYFKAVGWLSLVYVFITTSAVLAVCALFLIWAGVAMRAMTSLSFGDSTLVVYVITGTLSTGLFILRSRKWPRMRSVILSIATLPLLLAFFGGLKLSIGSIQGGVTVRSLHFSQSTIGRIQELIDWRYATKTQTRTQAIVSNVLGLVIIALLVINPLIFLPNSKVKNIISSMPGFPHRDEILNFYILPVFGAFLIGFEHVVRLVTKIFSGQSKHGG